MAFRRTPDEKGTPDLQGGKEGTRRRRWNVEPLFVSFIVFVLFFSVVVIRRLPTLEFCLFVFFLLFVFFTSAAFS